MKSGDKKADHTWLILANLFNIDGNAASQTITDRLPFLISSNIKPVVISSPTGIRDKRFPHYQIFSAAPSGILFEVRHIINKKLKNNTAKKILKTLLLITLLPFYAVEKAFIHLDSHWSWFLTAFAKGIWVVKKHKPAIIYSTAGPTCTHLAGYLLSKTFKLPWLAELHDPLIYDTGEKKWQFYYFKRWLEKKIVENASAVVFFTNHALESVKRRNNTPFNGFVVRPGATIFYATNKKYTPGDKIHIGHYGALADNRNLKPVIKALCKIFNDNPELRSKVSLDIYGSNLDKVSKEYSLKYPLGDVLCEHGRLEYDPETQKTGRQQVLESMRQCDVLLLLHGEGVMCQEYIPSKTYEYLMTGRPILGLVEPESELHAMLKDGNHLIAKNNNINSIQHTLLKVIQNWQQNNLPIPQSNLLYTVENTVEKIKRIADDICNQPPPFATIRQRSYAKVLIIIRRSLGDVLATSPIINALYENDSHVQIDLLVNEDTYGMARAIRHVRKVLRYDYGWWDRGSINGIKNEFLLFKKIIKKYDLAISLTANERSTIYAIMAGRVSIAATDVVLDNSWWRRVLLSSTCKYKPNCHIILNNLATIKSLGIPVKKIHLSACYSDTADNHVRYILDKSGVDKFLIFHPSARYEYKVYPRNLRNKLLRFLNSLGIPIVITGGQSNIDLKIAKELPELKNIYNFIGKTSLEEAIALTNLSLGYIGMDTFNMHIAAAFNKKIVAIFGPTLPQMWSPWSNSLQTHAHDNNKSIQRYGEITLIRADTGCVSCGLAGCEDTSNHSKCLDAIAPEIIFEEVKLRWSLNNAMT